MSHLEGLSPPRLTLGRLSWALYDWAVQPVYSVITTFIFAPYFTAIVVGNSVQGQALWGYAMAVVGVLIAVLSPILGAIADAGGQRKHWTGAFVAMTALGCATLWIAVPKAPPGLRILILAAVVLTVVSANVSQVFNNAMLPGLGRPERIGRLSGFSWGLGYLGGLTALTLILGGPALLAHIGHPLDLARHQVQRAVGPVIAIWIVLFSIPLFLFTPEAKASRAAGIGIVRHGLARMVKTAREARSHHRNIVLFLIARMIAYDGLNAIFAFGGIYAAGIFRWSMTELGIFGLIILVFGAAGAWIGGMLDDRFGAKVTILAATAGVTLASLGVLSLTAHSIFFGIPALGPAGHGFFASTTERMFLLFAIMLGICGGPMQAASRSLLARLSPPEMTAELFGFYAATGQVTSFAAPLAVAIMTEVFASQRAGLAAILAFLIAGFFLLLRVEEPRST
jgi:UMF1 family MFS transporter